MYGTNEAGGLFWNGSPDVEIFICTRDAWRAILGTPNVGVPLGPLPLIKIRRIFENLLTLLPDYYAAKSNQMRDVIESNCNQYVKE